MLVLCVATMLFVAWRLGWFALAAEPALLRARLIELGPWGYVMFLAGFAVLSPFGLPGIVFVLAAAYIWPGPVAYGLSVTGAILGSAVGFGFARFVAREWVSARLPPRIRRFDALIERRGWLAAAGLRAVFLMHPLLHFLFGISRVRFTPYILGSTLGYLPSLAVVVWASDTAIELLQSQPKERILYVLGAVVLAVLLRQSLVWWSKRRRAAASNG